MSIKLYTAIYVKSVKRSMCLHVHQEFKIISNP